ncbi:MAG: hypothetical protein R3182_12875 [Draconibacterium sp.]|nr:hypothetical protein [Draconibacterium sp.]
MKSIKTKLLITIVASLFSIIQLIATETQKWYVVLDESLVQDEAIKVAIDDLKKAGEKAGIEFIKATKHDKSFSNVIIVGSPERSRIVKSLVEKKK